jgi:phosphate transport system permease protein
MPDAVSIPFTQSNGRFVETSFVRKKKRTERVAQAIFGIMAVAMIIPLALILGYLMVQAWPLLSWDFLVTNPIGGMRKGGIWSALLGTIYLVVISLAVAAPIGVLAAVYLNEYARDNWFNRIVNLAVVNLAGVPSISPAWTVLF